VDRLELMQMLLGHPETDLRVDLGEFLLDVRDVRYSAEREAIVLLLDPDDVRDVLRCPFRERAPDERPAGPNGSPGT
jgi:hypothetical protein